MPAHVEIVGGVVRTGRRKPREDRRTARFATYSTLPRTRSRVNRSHWIATPWGMMENDAYGDCTAAAAGHAIQVATGTVSKGSKVVTVSDAEILDAYWATGKPPDPGADDNGRYELDVLNHWRNVGVGGHKIHAFAALDVGESAKARREVKLAMALFGFAYIGVGLPVSAQRQSVWKITHGPDAEPWSWGGHAVVLVDYDERGPTCVTWGKLVRMSWGFLHRYMDEAWAVITPEWLDAKGRSVDGFDLDALERDLAAIS